jgi:hypothetical protein
MIFAANEIHVTHNDFPFQYTMNKPLSVGMTILELAKCIMYDHHYNHVIKKVWSQRKTDDD